MSNKKISELSENINPTLLDVFPIVNNGVTKKLTLSGLTTFIEPYITNTNTIFTGGTVTGNTIFTNGLTATTISATTYRNLPLDITVTGGTYSNGTAVFANNTGGTFSVSGFSTGYTLTSSAISSTLGYIPLSAYTDITVTGGTYSDGIAIFTNNTGGTFSVSGFSTGGTSNIPSLNDVTTISGVSLNPIIIEGVTGHGLYLKVKYLDDTHETTITPEWISVSHFERERLMTLLDNQINFTSSGNSKSINFGSVDYPNSSYIIPDKPTGDYTFAMLEDVSSFVTGFTFNPSNYDISISQNDGSILTQNLGVLATDMTVTGGTYDVNTGIVTFTNNSGGTFTVSGFTSGMTDSFTTGATLNGSTVQFGNNVQGSNFYNVDLSPLISGKTDFDLFVSHTGNTNNPHSTNFSNLTSTAHTHSISDITNLNSIITPTTGVTFNGSAISLDKITGTSYLPYTQVSAITFTLSGTSVGLGFAAIAITANGSAITPIAAWKNVGNDVISTVNGAVNRFIITQIESEVWYTVKVN